MRRDDLQGCAAHSGHLIVYIDINIFCPSSYISFKSLFKMLVPLGESVIEGVEIMIQ